MATVVTGRSIAVDGLKETVNGFRKIRPELGRASTRASKKLTDRLVVPTARLGWASQRVKPSVATSAVVSAAGQTWAGVRVRYRSEAFPYGAGVVFGSKQHKQFRSWIGNQSTGAGGDTDYIVGPAVRAGGDRFSKEWMKAIEKEIVEAIK